MKKIPEHLKKYVVEQNYDRYTSEDQAVWRYIMRQLKSFLSQNAHECYLDGLERTGLTTDQIPKIDEMNLKLQEFGWGAVPVSGFIPPAAFMEFQALGFLPIASDMRSIDHILYTPAPDIVHEAAGHAPILVDPGFAKYLKSYAEVASKAIISHEDLALYEAIRVLSDIKEKPGSTEAEIKEKEQSLIDTVDKMTFVSEASLLGRMNWWTAEYGLIGKIEEPQIFGAGLLSSVGESKECLGQAVQKIPLTIDCVNYSYDITEPQPQLFVTPTFENLTDVLHELSEEMSFKKGGTFGLIRAIEAKTVNTIELDTGLQISGVVDRFLEKDNQVFFVKLSSPTQICLNNKELDGHSKDYHSHGYSTPLGPIKNASEVKWEEGQEVNIEYESHVKLRGVINSSFKVDGRPILVQLKNCSVTFNNETLFDPEWGLFDLALGQEVSSVFGGPADRAAYGDIEDFVAKRVPLRELSKEQKLIDLFYEKIRDLRNSADKNDSKKQQLSTLIEEYRKQYSSQWLIGVELLELCHLLKEGHSKIENLKSHLQHLKGKHKDTDKCIDDGISLSLFEL